MGRAGRAAVDLAEVAAEEEPAAEVVLDLDLAAPRGVPGAGLGPADRQVVLQVDLPAAGPFAVAWPFVAFADFGCVR